MKKVLFFLMSFFSMLPSLQAQHVLIKKPTKQNTEVQPTPSTKVKTKTVVVNRNQDRDNDGIVDDKDDCPDEYGPIKNGGCPVVVDSKPISSKKNQDRDNDGIVDDKDDCPDEYGPIKNGGCPVVEKKRNTKEPEMVYVQGGSFDMGSNTDNSDEKPIHTVNLNSYYIGKYEVTVKEFEQFISANNYQTEAEKGDGSYIWNGSKWDKRAGINWRYDAQGTLRDRGSYNHPVIHVSWNDAIAYCNWLSETTGKHYRLPTEAEWEYAARGANKSNGYNYSGSNNIESVAWYDGTSGGSTHAVGQKEANELGIYDMSGNVWEWCSDWYGDTYYSNSIRNNPLGPSSGSIRVLRGGSWYYFAQFCRVAIRDSSTPGYRISDSGFRVALVP